MFLIELGIRGAFGFADYECGGVQIWEGTLPWVTSSALGHARFFKWEENQYFSPYAYRFIYKSDLLNPNFVKKKLFNTVFLPKLLFRWAG